MTADRQLLASSPLITGTVRLPRLNGCDEGLQHSEIHAHHFAQ
jgi:hypothetical protein